MKLVFEVELGNEAMQTLDDVAAAFNHTVARYMLATGRLSRTDALDDAYTGTDISVRDRNGNTVGTLAIVGEEER